MARKKELLLCDYPKTDLDRQLRVYTMALFTKVDLHKRLYEAVDKKVYNKDFCIENVCKCLENPKQVVYSAMMDRAFGKASYMEYIAIPLLLELDDNFENEIKREFIKKCHKYYKKVSDAKRKSKGLVKYNTKLSAEDAEKLAATLWVADMVTNEVGTAKGSYPQHIALTFYTIANCEELFNGGYKLDTTMDEIHFGYKSANLDCFDAIYIMKCLENADYFDSEENIKEFYLKYRTIYKNHYNVYFSKERLPLAEGGKFLKERLNYPKDAEEDNYDKAMEFFIGVGVLTEHDQMLENFLTTACKNITNAGDKLPIDGSRKGIRAMIASDNIAGYAECIRAFERMMLECSLLTRRCEESGSAMNNVEQKIEKLEREVRRKQSKNEQLRDEVTKEKEKSSKLESQVRKFEKGKQLVDDNSKKVEELQKEVDRLKKENRTIVHTEDSLKAEIKELKEKLRLRETEVSELSEERDRLEEVIEAMEEEPAETLTTEQMIEEIETMLGGRRLFVVGGTTDWGTRFTQNFKYAVHKTLNEAYFDDVTNNDYLVLSILQMKHRLSKPLIDRCRSLGIKYTFISNSNTDRVLQKVHKELKSEHDSSSGVCYKD